LSKAKPKQLIIADTGPLIALAIMDLLPVLNLLYDKVLVPDAVIKECSNDLSKPQSSKINQAINDNFLTQASVIDKDHCSLLEEVLDQGEAEAITLAIQLNAVVLLDEKIGRKIAQREGMKVVGSLFILIKAKQVKYIPSAAPLLDKLKLHGYYMSDSLVRKVLEVCNEI